jgi:hypothetical protein
MFSKENNENYRLNRGYKTGCYKKCPCRGWINCPAYVDVTEQQQRLKRKSDGSWKGINIWYETNFRIKYEYGDSIANG